MDAKHSPGPWSVDARGVRNRGGYICHTNAVQQYEGQDERYAQEVAQREADKRLIAAAPYLLLALQNLLELCDQQFRSPSRNRFQVAQARVAIAKATGSEA